MTSSFSSTEKKPPAAISIEFCRVCGRDDRFRAFVGKGHYHNGTRCPGFPTKIVYGNPRAVPVDGETE